MPFVNCAKCEQENSNSANVCVRCGAPILAAVLRPVFAVAPSASKIKWWLIVPLGALMVLMIIGTMIPEHIAGGNTVYQGCREMFKKGQVQTMAECEAAEAWFKNQGNDTKPAPQGGDAAAIKAALADGARNRGKSIPSQDWPVPAANLFEGQTTYPDKPKR